MEQPKLSEEMIEDIIKNQPEDSRVENLFLTDDEFEKFKDSSFDLEKYRLKKNEDLIEIYRTLQDILKQYIDMREDYYPLIALWIIGTYIHKSFIINIIYSFIYDFT